MEKFFIELLPVNNKKVLPGDVLKSEMTSGNPIGPNKAQMFRRYVCSRDIQVGDTFWANESFRKCSDKKEGDYPYKDETDQWHSKHWFRVVGEISPAATWVKEGNEFDSSQIEMGGGYIIFYDVTGRMWTKITPDEQEVSKAEWPKDCNYIKFKCPTCGTFH